MDSITLGKIKLGLIVEWTSQETAQNPRSGLPNYSIDYPAVIYKIHPGEDGYVGLYAYTDDGLRLLRMVTYSSEKKPETWRFQP